MVLAVLASGAGLLVLGIASDRFVTGAARLAIILHRSPVVVGTVISAWARAHPSS